MRIRSTPWTQLVFVFTALAMAVAIGCSGQHLKDPDGDGDRNHARPFSKMGPTEDKLNPRVGDKEDWRFVQPDRAGRMEMRISVGKWEESSLAGHVTIYTEVGDRIAEKALPTGSGTLKFRFEVESDMKYLIRFRATRGKGEYAVEVDWGSDPCAECSDNEDCIDKRCVRRSSKPAPSGNKCKGVHCPSGQICSRKTGRCFKPRPRCPKGHVYKGGKCVEKLGPIKAKIIDARAAGTGSLLIINVGANKGVRRGAKGKVLGLRGGSFVVTDVYPSRSKARCNQPPAKIYSHPNATIRR